MRTIIFSIIVTLAIFANLTITYLYYSAFNVVPTRNETISKYFNDNKCTSSYVVRDKQKRLMDKMAVSGKYKILEKITKFNYDLHRLFATNGHVRPFSFSRIYVDFAYPKKYDSMHSILKHQFLYNTLYRTYGKGKIILPKKNRHGSLFPIFIETYTYLKIAYSNQYDALISSQQEKYLKHFQHISEYLNFMNDCGNKNYILIENNKHQTLYLLQGKRDNYVAPRNILKGMPK